MSDNALELVAVHLLKQTCCHSNGGVFGISARRECVWRLVFDDIDTRLGYPGCNGHALDEVVQLLVLNRISLNRVADPQGDLVGVEITPPTHRDRHDHGDGGPDRTRVRHVPEHEAHGHSDQDKDEDQ